MEVIQKFNMTRAYNFMHIYFSNNLITWSESQEMKYLDLAVVKFTDLANKDDLLDELD